MKKYLRRACTYVLSLFIICALLGADFQYAAAAAEKTVSVGTQAEACGTKSCSASTSVYVCSNMKTCYNYLYKTKGYNLAVTCAILANMQLESEFIPTCVTGQYYGLVQWSSSRTANLKTYCSAHNKKYNTVAGQLAFMTYEMQNDYYSRFLNVLKTGVENTELGAVYAAWVFTNYYEGAPTRLLKYRQQLARKYWEYFTSGDYMGEVSVTGSNVTFPSTVGTSDSYTFSGTVKCSASMDILKIGIAYYTAYADNSYTERKVAIGSFVSAPKVISVKPESTSYKLSRISTKWNFSSLSPGTYTFYMVAMVNGTGHTVLEKNFKVVSGSKLSTDTQDQTAIDTVTPKLSNKVDGVSVSWSKVSGISGYYIWRKCGSGDTVKLATVSASATAWKDTSAEHGKKYRYYVTGYKGSKRAVRVGTDIIFYKPPVVTISNTAKGIKISWKKISAATGYIIYRKAEGGTYSKLKTIGNGDTTSYTDTQVVKDNGALYGYVVKMTDGTYYSNVRGGNLYRVTGIALNSVSNVRTLSMKVAWALNPHADGYQVQYATDSAFTKNRKTITLASGSTATKKISSLSKKTYYVRVRAYILRGEVKCASAWSGVKKVTISV